MIYQRSLKGDSEGVFGGKFRLDISSALISGSRRRRYHSALDIMLNPFIDESPFQGRG
jgi:hypothetical protein